MHISSALQNEDVHSMKKLWTELAEKEGENGFRVRELHTGVVDQVKQVKSNIEKHLSEGDILSALNALVKLSHYQTLEKINPQIKDLILEGQHLVKKFFGKINHSFLNLLNLKKTEKH